MFYYLLLGLSNYFNFKGRATRKEYWFFVLTKTCIYYALMAIYGIAGLFMMFGTSSIFSIPSIILIIFTALLVALVFLMLIPGLALLVRRMHDIGMSGKWLFLPFGLMLIFPSLLLMHLGLLAFLPAVLILWDGVFLCYISTAFPSRFFRYFYRGRD